MVLKRLDPFSFHYKRIIIRVLIIFTLVPVPFMKNASVLIAQAEPTSVKKTACLSALGYEELDALKADLRLQAKREAVKELFGELIIASTTVEDFVVTNDQILASSVGFVREKDSPEYSHGKELADVCIVIDAYITEEDRQKLEPISLAGSEECISNENLSLRELEQVAENRAVLSVLQNRYPELIGHDEEKVLLLLKNKVFKGELDSRTGAYCTSVNGQVFPIEVQTFLSETTQVVDDNPTSELVISRLCNLRAGPGTSFEIIAKADTGDKLIVIGANIDNTWWQITHNDQIAWVSEACVDNPPTVTVDTIASKSDAKNATSTSNSDLTEQNTVIVDTSIGSANYDGEIYLIVDKIELLPNKRMRWHISFWNKTDGTASMAFGEDRSYVTDELGTRYGILSLSPSGFINSGVQGGVRLRGWLDFDTPTPGAKEFKLYMVLYSYGSQQLYYDDPVEVFLDSPLISE